jgi:hypothetical protein
LWLHMPADAELPQHSSPGRLPPELPQHGTPGRLPPELPPGLQMPACRRARWAWIQGTRHGRRSGGSGLRRRPRRRRPPMRHSRGSGWSRSVCVYCSGRDLNHGQPCVSASTQSGAQAKAEGATPLRASRGGGRCRSGGGGGSSGREGPSCAHGGGRLPHARTGEALERGGDPPPRAVWSLARRRALILLLARSGAAGGGSVFMGGAWVSLAERQCHVSAYRTFAARS